MADIFISYASDDREQARMMSIALEEAGWTVWWDRTILPGKAFDRAIEQALGEARAVVVLWSACSVESDWVKDEISDAARDGTLVPVLIEPVAIPLGFRRLQAADLSNWNGDTSEPEFQNVIAAIGEIMMRTQGAVPERKPAKKEVKRKPAPKAEKSWSFEVIQKSDSRLLGRVHLTHEVHLLEWHEYLVVGGKLKVNEVLVSESRHPFREVHAFELKDGNEKQTAELLVTGVTDLKFALTVGGVSLLRDS